MPAGVFVRAFEKLGTGNRRVGTFIGVLGKEREVDVSAGEHAQLEQVADDAAGRQFLGDDFQRAIAGEL